MKTIGVLYLALCLLLAGAAWGQAVSSVSGILADASGGVIPGASVKIENFAQGLSRETKSDQEGRYTFPQVPPGIYRVSAQAAGFAEVVVNDVLLQVNVPRTLDLKMEVGAVTESVAVSAAAAQVN